ncbi:MAG: DMT family transporter [Candidatus Thermoplasmatota archaeon]|nr:DMT family transporter [Candidatus Thermoplasmatota archaeon]
MTTRLLPVLLVLIALVWAGSFIVVEHATREIDPVDLGFLRFLVATPLLLLLVGIMKKPLRVPKKELPWLLVLGLTGVTLLYLFQFVGISSTNAPTAAVLINTNVIFIALLSAVVLHEQLSPKRLIGILLSFSGVIVIVFSGLSTEVFSLTNGFFIGCLLILLSALCWALYSLVGKRLLATYDAVVITTYAFLLGILCYLPFVITRIGPVLLHTTISGWLAVLCLAVACTVFGYLGWYYALHHTDASKAAVFLNFIPLFTILLSWFLGTPLTWVFLLGAAFIIYGVYLTQKT